MTEMRTKTAPRRDMEWVQLDKRALRDLDTLIRTDASAARLAVWLTRQLRDGGRGVVLATAQTMADHLGVSERTVKRAIARLVEDRWVQRIRIGGAFGLALSSQVAWVGPRDGVRYVAFSATVIASSADQLASDMEPTNLRTIPTTRPGEVGIEAGDVEPPEQRRLDGVPLPAVALRAGEDLDLETGEIRPAPRRKPIRG